MSANDDQQSAGDGSAASSPVRPGGGGLTLRPGEAGTSQVAGVTRFAPPAINLPKGGGAIRGIGEKFTANPVTGTGSMSVPIATSPGRSGFGPQLSLTYDSGHGNGHFGFGWTLSLPAITRKTDKGLPRYRDADESDVYVLSGAEDLVPVLAADGTRFEDSTTVPDYLIHRYRPRIEGLFARIERWTERATGEIHWRSISRDNVTTVYGRTNNSRIFDPADPTPAHPTRIFRWLVCESYDDNGNAIAYRYEAEDKANVELFQANERNRIRTADRYLKCIKYGNRTSRLVQPDLTNMSWLFEVVFDYDEGHYEELEPDPGLPAAEQHRFVRAAADPGRGWTVRPDPFSSHRSGFEVRTYRRCHRVLMFHRFAELGEEPCLVRSTTFDYADLDYSHAVEIDAELAHQGSTRFASFIRSVTQSGFVRDAARPVLRRNGANYVTYLTKSLPPLEFEYSKASIGEEVHELDAESLKNLPVGLDGATYQWVDLDGEGVSGILTEQADAWFYKANLGGGRFGPLQTVNTKPSLAAVTGGRQQLLDLAGDGQLDLVALAGPTPGFYERTQHQGWESFRAFRSLPNVAWDDPNLRFIDLDGDGHADVLVTEQDILTWYPSLAEAGFAPARQVHQSRDEERGPRVLLADGTQSIHLADMCGDGLSDLVRIRNGEVCYWPNLGYGRFGGKVTMDNAPWFDSADQFDQRRIRLADLDGSGPADILYLHRDGVRMYFNQSGNRLSEARPLNHFPPVDNLSSVVTTDLLGNGTTCLVWSSPLPADAARPMRYIDLIGGQKPHLLVGAKNNLGLETLVRYASSTRFYLDDLSAGKPWITRLPFPVHVVERVETFDTISRSKLTTLYRYHHGYFDGVEREFRGFGLVEQVDAESFAAYAGAGLYTETPEVSGEEFHLPPVRTRTWYHTGAFVPGTTNLGQMRDEYYKGDRRAEQLPDTMLPPGLTPDEARQAGRALKGKVLRQEVYADDESPAARDPYSATEHSYRLRRIQPMGENRHAVFWVCSCQTLSYHYERHSADPRVTHELTLETDEFGNVVKSAAIAYPRRADDPALSDAERASQQRLVITYTDNHVANRPDVRSYRVGVPIETRTYELTGIGRPDNLLTISSLLGQAIGATTLDYDATPDPNTAQKRLIEHVRTYYYADNLGGPLPLGDVGSRALVYETYKLALTPGLVERIYEGRLTDAMLFKEGRYVHTEGDMNWWIPSGRAHFAEDAPAHFYLSAGYVDPFGNVSRARYDTYDLLLIETTDPLGNRVTVETRDISGNVVQVENDYRVLQPRLVYDPNGNRSAVAFDSLGMVVGTALMGRAGASEGDTLEAFAPDLDAAAIAAHLADPLADPVSILGGATTRLVYGLERYRLAEPAARGPAAVYSLSRVTHAADAPMLDATGYQHAFTYFDGFGREAMRKAQAEPGLAPSRGPDGVLRCDHNLQPTDPRWVGTGRIVYDNKGNPVRQYEPFFSPTHEYEDEKDLIECGVTSIRRYDPLGRLVRIDEPDGTFSRVEFDPWRQASYDENDTVRESRWYADRAGPDPGGPEPADAEARAAWLAARHADTPTVVHFDTAGRPYLSINDDGLGGQHRTRHILDVEGNQLAVIDVHGREVIRRDFDMLGSTVRVQNADSGLTLTALDAGGKSHYSWDSRDHRIRLTYDRLRRPERVYIRRGNAAERLVERTVYGEAHPDALARNLRTRYYQHYDPAGLVTNERNDFKGNALETTRRLAREYHQTPDWLPIDGTDDAALIAAPPAALLEAETFRLSTTFDALSRPTAITTPDASVVRPTYNEAGLLESLNVRLRGASNARGEPIWTPIVEDVDYDARGQRTWIRYGNGAVTEHAYDNLSFRLVGLRTTRSAALPAARRVAQDLQYTYDPVGNVTTIWDAAQQPIFFDNRVVTSTAHFMYDALYRLTSTTGREHVGQTGAPQVTWDDGPRIGRPHPTDGQAMRHYLETYRYDKVGNLVELVHAANGGSWKRTFAFDEPSFFGSTERSNRLSRSAVAGADELFAYDAHGNVTSMPHLEQLVWDERDRLQWVDRGGGGSVAYAYDANGIRVRKVLERQNGTRQSERVYLGSFEIYRKYDGAGALVTLERETLHVTDDQRHVALVETRTQGNDASLAQLIRYQYANHLGTAALELDGQARVISYEEYYPFGGTAYQGVRSQVEAPKRYRYTGKERDEETGLYYHGARYYAPWLARWTTVDPAGLADGVNAYAYAQNNPVRLADPTGKLSWGQIAGIAAAVVVGTVVTVATAGLAGPVVGTAAAAVIGGIVGGAAGGAVGEITEAAVDRRPITAANVGRAALIGAAAGGVFSGAGVAAAAVARSAAGQALASRVASSAAAQVVRSTASRIAASAVGQATRRAATRVAASAVGQAVRRGGARTAAGLEAIEKASERVGQRAASALGRSARPAPAHIGAGGRPPGPSETNPTCSPGRCVADVGAHEANLARPQGTPPITNEEFINAAGRPVDAVTNPIANSGEATSFLNAGFRGLKESGRITQQITAETSALSSSVPPGKYLLGVKAPEGGHALHATVSEEVLGTTYRTQGGRFVTPSEAQDLADEGVRIISRQRHQTSVFDPQAGVSVSEPPQSEVLFWIRFNW